MQPYLCGVCCFSLPFRPLSPPKSGQTQWIFLWALVVVAEYAALFAVASKAELRFISIISFVLSATVDAVTMHLSGLRIWTLCLGLVVVSKL